MRDSKGKFIETTRTTRYKRKEKDGVNMQRSRYVWEEHNGPILKGYVIHHINKNKKDDKIEAENLNETKGCVIGRYNKYSRDYLEVV